MTLRTQIARCDRDRQRIRAIVMAVAVRIKLKKGTAELSCILSLYTAHYAHNPSPPSMRSGSLRGYVRSPS